MKSTELEWPAVWASAVFNGDDSGLDETETIAVGEALDSIASMNLIIVGISEDTHFGRFQGLGTELATYTAVER